MSGILVLDQPAKKVKKAKRVKRAGKVATVLRVRRGEVWVGDILLDRKGRVWRHVQGIPTDVVLKALAARTRGVEGGDLVGRRDGLTYRWELVPEKVEKTTAHEVAELAEAA